MGHDSNRCDATQLRAIGTTHSEWRVGVVILIKIVLTKLAWKCSFVVITTLANPLTFTHPEQGLRPRPVSRLSLRPHRFPTTSLSLFSSHLHAGCDSLEDDIYFSVQYIRDNSFDETDEDLTLSGVLNLNDKVLIRILE